MRGHSHVPLYVGLPARCDARPETWRSESMIEAESIAARAALELRVPGVFRDAEVVVPPQVGPAHRRQFGKVLGTDKRFALFIEPMRAGRTRARGAEFDGVVGR